MDSSFTLGNVSAGSWDGRDRRRYAHQKGTLAVMGWPLPAGPGPASDPDVERWRLQEQLRHLENCRQSVEDARASLDRLLADDWRGPAATAFARHLGQVGHTLRSVEQRLDATIDRCRSLLWTLP